MARMIIVPTKDGLPLPERLCCAGQHVAGSNRTAHAVTVVDFISRYFFEMGLNVMLVLPD